MVGLLGDRSLKGSPTDPGWPQGHGVKGHQGVDEQGLPGLAVKLQPWPGAHQGAWEGVTEEGVRADWGAD